MLSLLISCSTVGDEESYKRESLSKYTDDELEFSLFEISDYRINFTRKRDYAFRRAILNEMDKRPQFSIDRVRKLETVAQLDRHLWEKFHTPTLSLDTKYDINEFLEEFGSIDFHVYDVTLSCSGSLNSTYSLKARVFEKSYDWPNIRALPANTNSKTISPYFNIKIYFRNGAYKKGIYIGNRTKLHTDSNNYRDNFDGNSSCNI